MFIHVPVEAQEVIANWPNLPTEQDELWFEAQRIYAKETFGDWLDENMTGGFDAAFDEVATRENVEVVLDFHSLEQLMRFQVAFNIKGATYVEVDD